MDNLNIHFTPNTEKKKRDTLGKLAFLKNLFGTQYGNRNVFYKFKLINIITRTYIYFYNVYQIEFSKT